MKCRAVILLKEVLDKMVMIRSLIRLLIGFLIKYVKDVKRTKEDV